MALHIHLIDPHYSHDFADLYFEGKRFCITDNKRKPFSPLEMLAVFATKREARSVLLAKET